MRLTSRRAGVAFGIVAILASSCAGSPTQATLTDTPGVDTAEADQVLADAEGSVALPTPHPPELLRFETNIGSAIPAELALELPGTTPVGPWSTPAPPTTSGKADLETGDPSEDGTGTEDAVDPRTDQDDDTTTVVGDEIEGGEPATVPLPTPPKAASARGPRYRDPSDLIVGASGRDFTFFDLSEVQTVPGLTNTRITVGGLATQTLVGNPHRQDVCLGARARFEQANHHSELSRVVDFVSCHDDGGHADISAGLAGSLVREDVFAIAPLASPSFFAAEQLHEAPILYIGDERLPGFCGRANPLGFGIYGAQGCPVLDARGYAALVDPVLTAYAAAVGDGNPWANLTYVAADSPTGQAVAAARGFEARLLDVVPPWFVFALPSAGDGPATNWSETVATILDTSPDTVVLEAETTAGLPAALRDAGFDGQLVWVGAIDPLDIVVAADRLELAPMMVVTPGLDLASNTSLGAKALAGAAAAVGMPPYAIGLDFVEGYLAADFLVRALEATPEPLSIEALANTVNGGWWYPGVDGVSCGSWWPASHFVVTPCVSVSLVQVFSDRLVPILALVEVEPQVQFNLGQ